MNNTLVPLASLALAVFFAGCSSPSTPVAPAETDRPTRVEKTAPDADIRVILELQRRGEITETQALRIIAALRGMLPPAEARPAPPQARAPAPAAPNAASVSEPVSRPSGYKAGAELTGRLRSVGSDSMDRMMEEWSKGFSLHHPRLRLTHEGKGSSTAVPALLEGRADVGPMSRPLKREEIEMFERRFGYAPIQIRAATDALAVYVHPSNPVAAKGLTLAQIDAVFSASRKRGGAPVVTWGDLGAEGEWKSAPVRVVSRNSASGTYGFFRDEVLLKGEFREDTRYLVGSAEVVAAVEADRFAIGYSGIGYKTPGVAAVRVASDAKSGYREPTETNAASGAYPVTRGLFVTLHHKPGEPVSELHREFVRYILSPQGQEAVRREGYFPVPTREVPSELQKLGLSEL